LERSRLVSFFTAASRLVRRPATSPSQRLSSASRFRSVRLAMISTIRWRCLGSILSMGHLIHACRVCRAFRRACCRCLAGVCVRGSAVETRPIQRRSVHGIRLQGGCFVACRCKCGKRGSFRRGRPPLVTWDIATVGIPFLTGSFGGAVAVTSSLRPTRYVPRSQAFWPCRGSHP
jgi:hypothetical protein